MARYVMTAKRKAALRKAQLASARVRRKAKSVKRPSKRRVAVTAAVVLATGGLFAYNQKMSKGTKRYPSTAVPVMSRNALGARPAVPGLTRQVKMIGMGSRPGRAGKVNLNRVRDPKNPYYQSRYNRGLVVLKRARRQAPPLRKSTTIFATDSSGVTRIKPRRTVAMIPPNVGIGYSRTKRQQQAYLANKARVARYSPWKKIPPASTIQY